VSAQGQGPDLTTEGTFRLGDTLYATRCSTAFFKCVTATTTVREAVQGEGLAVAAATTVGGLAGGFLGLFISYMLSRSLNMDQQLRRAIANERLGLAYQPIVNLDNGRIVGAEALSRWTDEDGVEVSPDVFIPVAEAGGMIGSITKQVVRNGLQTFGETLRTHSDFRLSVNVSASDLCDPGFLPMLDEAVKKAKIPPRSLVIEITESSAANRAEAMETIRLLRRRGHSIHIDDFGTGYSSLSYLLFLNVDTIKIDKAFIKAIGTESVTVAILPQILAMAEALKIGVVAEGVETEQQANYFSGAGRRIDGQGWLYGRPFPAEEFHCLLAEQWGKARDSVVRPEAPLAPQLGMA
jgi:sensor c-di-GMP phosphodiesterase-like protein